MKDPKVGAWLAWLRNSRAAGVEGVEETGKRSPRCGLRDAKGSDHTGPLGLLHGLEL